MTETIPAHGGTLINREVTGDKAAALADRARSLPSLRINSRTLSDLELIGIGGFSPLTGFMSQAQYRSVVNEMHLPDGLPWSLPVTLAATKDEATSFKDGQEIALTDDAGEPLAVFQLAARYSYDKKDEAQKCYRTTDEAHPGVAAMYAQGDVLLGRRCLGLPPPARALRGVSSDARRRRAPRSPSAAGAPSSASRRATRCTARTSTSRSARWRSSTACCCTRSSATPRATTSPPTCACAATRCCSTTTTRPTACCCPCCPPRCATPARARRSSTRSCARTTAARTSSSGATTPASATTTAPTTRS